MSICQRVRGHRPHFWRPRVRQRRQYKIKEVHSTSMKICRIKEYAFDSYSHILLIHTKKFTQT